jgi:hypothetical protein
VILGAIAGLFKYFLPKTATSPVLPFLFFFFMATTLLSFYFLQKAMDKKFIKFLNTFLLTTICKLFLYVVVMIAYVFVNRSDVVPFMLDFFILYLSYTIFEVVAILAKTRNQTTEDSGK